MMPRWMAVWRCDGWQSWRCDGFMPFLAGDWGLESAVLEIQLMTLFYCGFHCFKIMFLVYVCICWVGGGVYKNFETLPEDTKILFCLFCLCVCLCVGWEGVCVKFETLPAGTEILFWFMCVCVGREGVCVKFETLPAVTKIYCLFLCVCWVGGGMCKIWDITGWHKDLFCIFMCVSVCWVGGGMCKILDITGRHRDCVLVYVCACVLGWGWGGTCKIWDITGGHKARDHHTLNHLEGGARGGEKKAADNDLPRNDERQGPSWSEQRGTVLKAALGTLLRSGVERIWAFPSV